MRAIDCLVEYGYAKTTMRRIAMRAGVTPGALQHHFTSKTALLGELIGYIRTKTLTELFAKGGPSTRSTRQHQELLLDRMWRIYRGPLFTALTELGIKDTTEFIPGEILKQFGAIAASVGDAPDREQRLRAAIRVALDQHE